MERDIQLEQWVDAFIDKFIGEILPSGYVLLPKQWEFIHKLVFSTIFNRLSSEELQEHLKYIYVLFARQIGKTEAFSLAVTFLAVAINMMRMQNMGDTALRFQDGFQCGIFGPKGGQAQNDLRRIRKRLKPFEKQFQLTAEKDNNSQYWCKRVFRNDSGQDEEMEWWMIDASSASEESEVESATYHLIALEECQDITERKFEEEIKPMGAATNATYVFIGTASGADDLFYREGNRIQRQEPPAYFNVTCEHALENHFRHGAYRLHYNNECVRKGVDSDFMQMKYYNKFILDKKQFVTEEIFLRFLIRRPGGVVQNVEDLIRLLGGDEGWPKGVVPILAVDVAKDRDQTIVYLMTADWRDRLIGTDGGPTMPVTTLWRMWAYDGIRYDDQMGQIRTDTKPFAGLFSGGGTVILDATGDRGDMEDRFRQCGFNVIGVQFQGGMKPPKEPNISGPVNKSWMANNISDAINTQRFFIDAPLELAGSWDFYYDQREELNKIQRAGGIQEPQRIWKDCKEQFTKCQREWHGDRLDLHSPTEDIHDDHPICAMLGVHGGIVCKVIDMDQLKSVGSERKTSRQYDESRGWRDNIGAFDGDLTRVD